jgi:hypothetical protein
MDKDKTYNGWSNYETWNVALWIDNEQDLYKDAKEMARRAKSTGHLAHDLKDWIGEMAPDLGATMWADLLNAALSEVDWYEIAEHYREGMEDEDGGQSDD